MSDVTILVRRPILEFEARQVVHDWMERYNIERVAVRVEPVTEQVAITKAA